MADEGSSSGPELLPLPVLLRKAAELHQNLDAFIAKNRQAPDAVDKALNECRACVRAVEAAGLFSSNEEADDIPTADLKGLLAPFYLAELLTSSPAPGGPPQRHAQVEEGLVQYDRFLERCHQYSLLGEQASKMYKHEEEQGGQLDPNTKRAVKIERFKMEKALSAQLSVLEGQRSKAQELELREQDAEEAGPLGGARGWDEEDERHLWKAKLQLAALKALGQRQMLKEEQGLLAHAVKAAGGASGSGSGPGRPGGARAEMEEAQRLQVLEALRKVAGDLGMGGASKREQIRAGVFRPGHLPPTRTLAEQADIELEEARQREERERAARDRETARKAELGSDEDEEELRRQRARDDFRDANPKGWGNSKTKPCG